MPKRSKIVSGKVIAAVEQSRSAVPKVAAAEPVVSCDAAAVATAEITSVPAGDVKSRFQVRKEELETSRHASDPINMRRAEKRRAAEQKKKSKHQQKRLVDGADKDSLKKSTETDAADAKRIKSNEAKEGEFVFNRLDETDSSSTKPVITKKTISDPKQALQKLQAQKDKMAKLKATDAVKAAALEEKLQLKKALQKAEGISVKDDETLLKKTIQRREKEKNKSRETWIQKATEKKEADEKRQTKRTENIQSRIDAKKNKKMGIKVKKPKFAAKKQQKPKFVKKK